MLSDAQDIAVARLVRQSGMVSPEQLAAALQAQGQAIEKGQPISLLDALVQIGALTSFQRESLEKKSKGEEKRPTQKLSHYKLFRKLGEGGMGAVYLAEDERDGRKVALKVLPRKHASDLDFMKRFKREVEAAKQLDHPNIVRAFESGEDLGYQFYSMEYCEGESLEGALKRQGPFPWKQALGFVGQVARGLQYAHARGFIHRDIKPGNIFVTTDGTAKVLDLGLAKKIDESQLSFRTVTGAVLGTPHYISPEQARGDKEIDGRTDVYSLGATLYQLLTGEVPFSGTTLYEILSKHVNAELPNPQDIVEDIPDGVVHLLRRMMAKGRSDRYAECDELVADIEEILAGREPKSAVVNPGASSVAMARKLQGAAPRRRAGTYRVPLAPPPKKKAYLLGGGIAAAAVLVLAMIAFVSRRPSSSLETREEASFTDKSSKPEPIPPRKGEDRALSALKRLQDFAASSTDPEAILLRCDEARALLKGTPHEAKLREIEGRALEDRRLKADAARLDNFLAQIRDLRDRDQTFARKDEILNMLRSAARVAGPRRSEVERMIADYEAEAQKPRGTPPEKPSTPAAWPSHDGREPIADYAKRVGLPATETLDLGGGVKMEFVLVPAGEFTMGSNGAEAKPEEKPAHRVRISNPFYIGKYEVTVAQFRAFAEATKHVTDVEKCSKSWIVKDGKWQEVSGVSWRTPGFKQDDRHPVCLVLWNDAKEYCRWAGKATGRSVCLPTEAQWEYAAKGSAGSKYPWGDQWVGTEVNHADVTWRKSDAVVQGWDSTNDDDTFAWTAPVGSFRNRASGWGTYDMAGNVWEWVEDFHSDKYYQETPALDPKGPGTGNWHVVRGGSWIDLPLKCRSTYRGYNRPGNQNFYFGFRCAMDAVPPAAIPPAAPAGEGWTDLFDGKSLDGWKVIDKPWGGSGGGSVLVKDGTIIMERGRPSTRMAWTRNFPDTNYEVVVEAMRLGGEDDMLRIVFPTPKRFCFCHFGGYGNTLVGIGMVDGKHIQENPTMKRMSFQDGRWYMLRVRVTGTRIVVWVGDEIQADQDTASRTIGFLNSCQEMRPFGMDNWNTKTVIRAIRMRRLAPDADPTGNAPSSGPPVDVHPSPENWPIWNGKESIAAYAARAKVNPTQELDLGGGMKMEFVLIPAGTYTMGGARLRRLSIRGRKDLRTR